MEAIKGSFIKSHPLEIETNQQGKKIGMFLLIYLNYLFQRWKLDFWDLHISDCLTPCLTRRGVPN